MSAPEQWTCQCKEGYSNLFRQAVDGASCDIETACDAEQPILNEEGAPKSFSIYHSLDSNGNPTFTDGFVYGNRITSYQKTTEQCIVPTTKQNRDTPFNMDYYTVSEDADPTCIPQQYSNKCTIAGPGSIWTTIRGSNNPGDPEEFRISPAFAPPPPMNMQLCPDNWSGDGTPSNPCVSSDNSVHLILYEENKAGRDWYPLYSSIKDVQAQKIGGSFGTTTYAHIPWKTVNQFPKIKDPVCYEFSKIEDYDTEKNNYPLSYNCKGPECTGAVGNKLKSWDGSKDGELFDDETKPSFVTELPYGGQCTCNNFTINPNNVTVGQRPAYSLPGGLNNENAWWSCVPDSCWNKDILGGYYNGTECNCATASGKLANNKFKSAVSWKPDYQPPRCIKDPCNPGGFATQRNDLTREFYAGDCINNFVCKNNECYYKSAYPCTSNNECQEVATGFENSTVCSSDGYCLFADLERRQYGTKCNCPGLDDTKPCLECAMGSHEYVDPITGVSSGCTSHCVCGFGYEQLENDDNPVGFKCQDMCNPNPCLNGGVCSVTSDGVRQCACIPCFSGDLCETMADEGSRPGDSCNNNYDCCTGYCDMDGHPDSPSTNKRCAQPTTDWNIKLPTQLISCSENEDCPQPQTGSTTCTQYTFGKFCQLTNTETNCDLSDSNACIDKTGKYIGECKPQSWDGSLAGKNYCYWTPTDKYVTVPDPPVLINGETAWGNNEFECMEGKWNLLELSGSYDVAPKIKGSYQVYRLPGKANVGKFQVVNDDDISSEHDYYLSEGLIEINDPSKDGWGIIKYQLVTYNCMEGIWRSYNYYDQHQKIHHNGYYRIIANIDNPTKYTVTSVDTGVTHLSGYYIEDGSTISLSSNENEAQINIAVYYLGLKYINNLTLNIANVCDLYSVIRVTSSQYNIPYMYLKKYDNNPRSTDNKYSNL